jgi:hypothetical protein
MALVCPYGTKWNNKKMSNSETSEGLTSDESIQVRSGILGTNDKKLRVTVLPSYSTRSEITSVEYATADLITHSL